VTNGWKSGSAITLYVIKFFADEGTKSLDILRHPREHYRPRALSRSRVFFWARDVRLQRRDIAHVIARRQEEDSHLPARKRAEFLQISPMTV
jgi:hypothetical protein